MQLNTQNFFWWQVINIAKNGTRNVVYRSKIAFMVFVWNSEVKIHKLNLNKVFTHTIYSQHLKIIRKNPWRIYNCKHYIIAKCMWSHNNPNKDKPSDPWENSTILRKYKYSYKTPKYDFETPCLIEWQSAQQKSRFHDLCQKFIFIRATCKNAM